MASGRVLVDVPPFPLEVVRGVLAGTGLAIESPPRPWARDDVVGLLVWAPVGRADFGRLPALKAVATCGVGYDHIDVASAARRGIAVCNVPDYGIDEVADSALGERIRSSPRQRWRPSACAARRSTSSSRPATQ